MILSFRTDMPRQTVQTQIRLIRVCTVCHSVCIVWTHYSMVEPYSSNFRVITTNILGVRIFMKFTVGPLPPINRTAKTLIRLDGCSGWSESMLGAQMLRLIWAATWQNQQCGCAPSEDSDQPGHSPSLIRVLLSAWRKHGSLATH